MKRYLQLLLLLLGCTLFQATAAVEPIHIASKNGVTLNGRPNPIYSNFVSYSITNNTDKRLTIVSPGGSIPPHQTGTIGACSSIMVSFDGEPQFTLMSTERMKQALNEQKSKINAAKQDDNVAPSSNEPVTTEKKANKPDANKSQSDKRLAQHDEKATAESQPAPKNETVTIEQMVNDFKSTLLTHEFYGTEATDQRRASYDKLIENLAGLSDGERKAYVESNDIQAYIERERKQLEDLNTQKLDFIDDFLSEKYDDNAIADRKTARTELGKIISEQLDKRNHQLAAIGKMADVDYREVDTSHQNNSWPLMVVLLAVLAALCGAAYWIHQRGRGKGRNERPSNYSSTSSSAPRQSESNSSTANADGIVVRRRTTSVLKRQDISDVVDNDNFLCIETANMCPDSAVRRIYIKNTCVKDIYNMYAEDLRNASNPKEDGCMVLGRWVLDGVSDKYDITLEQIVLPGDDAVFAEYELNFGGKIKLSVAEKLRLLRRESNLQYDLTCWVHSHPGLGVFFSNSDNNVHNQLKHPTQPHFLTAMVVDILTPDQTLGIFTFKRDGSVTSQADLRRMFSLEEMYQWAIASERSGFNAQDYFNTLMGCKRSNECSGVQLSNGAVIDIMHLTTSPITGLAGYVHGFVRTSKEQQTEYIAEIVRSERSIAGKERVGCLVVDTHCSLPTVRRMVADELADLHFILVYATGNDELTAIPVVNGELCGDENYYGVNKLEDLKIWTRRKR